MSWLAISKRAKADTRLPHYLVGAGVAVRVEPGNAKPPPPGSIGELKWDSGSGTYFGVDPKLDMVYLLMEQTQSERSRITPAFKALVYEAFGK